MGTETELKFEVAPQDLRKLKAAPALHRKPPKEENLISVYFDTPKHKAAKIEMVINLKTAKELGITFPLALLGRADEVIE